jgi:hypothetical protein
MDNMKKKFHRYSDVSSIKIKLEYDFYMLNAGPRRYFHDLGEL